MAHALLHQAARSADTASYAIKPHKAGVAIWKHHGHGNWGVIATCADRDLAELLLFALAPPVWGRD